MRTIANPTTPGLAMIIPALWATQVNTGLSLAPAILEEDPPHRDRWWDRDGPQD
jgi:hypothetical protein